MSLVSFPVPTEYLLKMARPEENKNIAEGRAFSTSWRCRLGIQVISPFARSKFLREVDLIACEDTRRTGAMLAAHQIRKPLISHFEHNEERRVPELIERMVAGERIALVTDAGTPAISDPGYRLVRAAHEAGIRVTAVPGASAAIAALSISGIATNRFTFEGFLPSRDSARRKALEALPYRIAHDDFL